MASGSSTERVIPHEIPRADTAAQSQTDITRRSGDFARPENSTNFSYSPPWIEMQKARQTIDGSIGMNGLVLVDRQELYNRGNELYNKAEKEFYKTPPGKTLDAIRSAREKASQDYENSYAKALKEPEEREKAASVAYDKTPEAVELSRLRENPPPDRYWPKAEDEDPRSHTAEQKMKDFARGRRELEERKEAYQLQLGEARERARKTQEWQQLQEAGKVVKEAKQSQKKLP